MRIAVIHSFYRSAVSSGENRAVLLQAGLLSDMGHEVSLVARHTDRELQNPLFFSLRAAQKSVLQFDREVENRLAISRPDLIWLHNIFPNFGMNWSKKIQVPLVHSLHNFRYICASATLYRDGNQCFKCPDVSQIYGLRHKCYKASVLATVPLVINNWRGPQHIPVISNSQRIFALSQKSFDIFARYGIPREKMRVLPNFVRSVSNPRRKKGREFRWVIISRLSVEKGVVELLNIWPQSVYLDIYGQGDLDATLQHLISKRNLNVRLQGPIASSQVQKQLLHYSGLVFPSRVLENSPLTVLEAFSCGLPVMALEGSSGAQIVKDSGAGVVYPVSATNLDSYRHAVESDYESMCHRALKTHRENYSSEAWSSLVSHYLSGLRAGA